ncbi:CXC-rich/ GLUG motif protein [Giardia duodenalis assemblage B]|uniref:CXC-rich/ GLUG motif protein n=1 Tax=Giardia duodenalis assemblage B TaxID=1394984 RepID=A0A132P0A4_GIAIN|nr:CXC-rich/ GLUG motif protein [Giardia intestinalis assemblage B]
MLALLQLLPCLFSVSVSTETELRKALSNGRDVTLTEDIALKLPWMPIPTYGQIFDGNGHSIRNISVSSDIPASQGSGLFSELTGGKISNLSLQFDTQIDSDLTLFGGVSAKVSSNAVVKNVSVSGTISINSRADEEVTAGCIFGTAEDTGARESSDTVRSNCVIVVNASNANVRLGGVIGALENTATVMHYAGRPQVGCNAKRCYVGGFTSMATGPVQDIHFTDSVINATALRHSVVGGIVGYGSNIQLCSSYNSTISVTSTGRTLAGVSVGGAIGETNTENYVINTTFIKASMIVLETRSSSYLGGVLGYGRHRGGTIKNSYAVVQSLRGYNNGGHMYGGGFLGYGNASSLNLSTCYMFVPEFQFFEKPGAGGHSYYGGFFGFINGSSSDTPLVHSIQAGMGKFEVRMVAQNTNAGNFGGAIEASSATLIERIVLMGAAGIWSGEAPENAAIFIGKVGEKISLKTILVNISIGNGNGLANTANFVNTFTGTATDIVYNSGIVKTSKFVPDTGTYNNFNIRVNETTQVSCDSYLAANKITNRNFNCATSQSLNGTSARGSSTSWTFGTIDNWEHDSKGWYLPKGMPVANSAINNAGLFMTIYLNSNGKNGLSWQQSGWDNTTIWRFGNTNPDDNTKAVPPSYPALRQNPESFLACSSQTCDRDSFFSPFMCNCLRGCPGLQNGQCSSYNGAACDDGWQTVGTSLCSGFSCSGKNQLCGGDQVATCDASSKLCKCTDVAKYYNISTKTCEMGCQGLTHGFCTGPGVAMCDKGWKDGDDGLCTVYSCSSDDPTTACGGSSVATCNPTYDVCKCTTSTSAYNPATKKCDASKCTIASGDHICIGENKAICMSNTWPSTGTSGETLCAHYNCLQTQKCTGGSVCDLETFACRCPTVTQYFDTTDSTCKEGCTGLAAHTGVCIESNKALCYKGYTSPTNQNLCSQYSCTDVDPTCGGHGTCSGGSCTCGDGAMKLNNTCYAGVCVQGTISASKDSCTCTQGWTTDTPMAPLQCTKPSAACPASIDVRSDADLIYLYSCGSATYNLLANVTVSYPWLPVPSFTGTFNGNGHTIRGIQLYENETVAALFKSIGASARISNLVIEFATNFSSSTITKVAGITPELSGGVLANVTVKGSVSVKTGLTAVDIGGLAITCANLKDVTFSGQIVVEGHSTVSLGALCASASSSLANLTASGSINCTSRGRCLVGGIVGNSTHSISSSSSNVTIFVSSANGLVGGIVSNTTGNLTGLTFIGNISSPLGSTDVAGGIAGLAKPQTTTQLLTIKNCSVASANISSSSAGGLVGLVETGAIEGSSVTLTAFEGSACVGGFVCNATGTSIAKSNSNIDALRFTASQAGESTKQYCGGFVATASGTTIEDSYSTVTTSNVETTSEAFVGGFVGNADGLTVKRSYTSGDSVKLIPSSILHFGGFVGSCICSVDSSFSNIVSLTLSKATVSSAHFGGFVGVIGRTQVGAGRTVSSPSQVTSSWAASSMSVLLSDAKASRVFYGGFSGEADASAIADSYTRSRLSVNNDINLYHTGFGAFNGRFNEAGTNITRCYADVGVVGASDLNFEGNSAYGQNCSECTRLLINSDQPGISDVNAGGRTAAELQKSETFAEAFGSTSAFAFEPGRMPMIVTTPNLDSVTNTYVYPSCNPATHGDCWDYENTWVVSPDGIGSTATAPDCKVSSCTYCDARNSSVCKICASRTFLDGNKACSACSSSCVECSTKASFCTTCKRSDVMPNADGMCIAPGLSSAAIAGISITVILVVAGVAGFLCWWFICRRKDSLAEKSVHALEPSVSTISLNASMV